MDQQHRVFWAAINSTTGHAFINGAGQGDGSVCGRAFYGGERSIILDRCWTCTARTPNDIYTEKDITMTAPKKQAPPTKSDAEILAEGLFKAAERYGLCDKYYDTMQDLSKKLSVPLPTDLITKQKELGLEMYVNNDEIHVVGFPVGKNGRPSAATKRAIEKYFVDAFAKVVAEMPPELGKVRGLAGLDVSVWE